MSTGTKINGRLGIAVVLWLLAWSCMVVALDTTDEPWPWGGLAIFLSVVAMNATLWWLIECVTHRALRQLQAQVEDLSRDHEVLPGMVAAAVAQALNVRRLGAPK